MTVAASTSPTYTVYNVPSNTVYNSSNPTISLIQVYDANSISTIYNNTSVPLLTVNNFLQKVIYSKNDNLIYMEVSGDFVLPGPMIPSGGVGNIYLSIPFVDISSSATITPPAGVDVLASLTVQGSTAWSPIFNIASTEYGKVGTGSTAETCLVIPLSNFFQNISQTNIVYRFNVKIFPNN